MRGSHTRGSMCEVHESIVAACVRVVGTLGM